MVGLPTTWVFFGWVACSLARLPAEYSGVTGQQAVCARGRMSTDLLPEGPAPRHCPGHSLPRPRASTRVICAP